MAIYAPTRFSAAIRRGLIEALLLPWPQSHCRRFSAAIRRGLIEATRKPSTPKHPTRFPRRFAAASLKRQPLDLGFGGRAVFRGDSPRPH